MVDNLNIYLLHWYFQHNQCLNIKKKDVHNIHRLAWGPRATAQRAYGARRHCPLGHITLFRINKSMPNTLNVCLNLQEGKAQPICTLKLD